MLDLKPNQEEAATILATRTGSLQTARMWLHLMLRREEREHPPGEGRQIARANARARFAEIMQALVKVNGVDDYVRQRAHVELTEEDAPLDAFEFRGILRDLTGPLDDLRWTLISELHWIEDNILDRTKREVRGRGQFYVRLDTLADIWARSGGSVSSGDKAFVSFLTTGASDVRGGRPLNVTSVVTRFGERHGLKRPAHRPKKSVEPKSAV